MRVFNSTTVQNVVCLHIYMYNIQASRVPFLAPKATQCRLELLRHPSLAKYLGVKELGALVHSPNVLVYTYIYIYMLIYIPLNERASLW